jgi:tetratricopeptide (TPR) repeat protein
MTALNAVLKNRFEESFFVSDAAKSDPELGDLAGRIEQGDTAPGALRSQDPEWVAARLWDRALTDSASHAAELRVWVDRWRLLAWPPLVAHKVWGEAAANAFRDTAVAVLASEPGLAGWDETRAAFIRQVSLRTGQPPASAERHIAPLPATLLDRAVWLGDLRLEGAIAGMMSTNQDLVGIIRLLLSDVEEQEFAPAPHPVFKQLIELTVARPEMLAVVLFKVRWSAALLADLLLYPATCALACWLIAQWPGPSGAWDRELRARDDQTTKAMAFVDAASVLGDFLEQGLLPPAEAASLLDVLYKTAKPVFSDEAGDDGSILAILRSEIAGQTAAVQQAIFAALSASMPQSGLGSSTFAAALDVVDAADLAESIDPAPLVSAYTRSVAAGGYGLSANRISVSATASLVGLAMKAPEALCQSFFAPIDVRSRIAAAAAPGVNPLTIEDETARSLRAHVRVLCRAVAGLQDSSPNQLIDALITTVRVGAVKHDEKGRVGAFAARFETDPYRGPRDRPIAADLAAALLALESGQSERLLAAILDIDEPAVLARMAVLAPLAMRDRIARRIAELTPAEAGGIRSLPEAVLRIEELLAAGASDAAAKFIEAERGLKTFGQVPGRELTHFGLDLRLKYLRGDWSGIAAAEPPSGLSGQARDSAVEAISFYRGLAALDDPAGDRAGAENVFTSLHQRHSEVAAYAVNLFAARISRLLRGDLFARLEGADVVQGRKALVEAEHAILRVQNLTAEDQEIFACNKALLLLALGQPDKANETLAAMTPIRLRDRAAAYSAVALSRLGRLPEALTVLDEAEDTTAKTAILQATRDHIQTGKDFRASANLSSDDSLTTRIQSALFQLTRMDHLEQAAVLVDAPNPFEKLITHEIRVAAGRVTSLAPMMTNVTIDSCEDDLSAHVREVLSAQVSYLGWAILDQSKGGRTAKGNPGERDLLVQKNGVTIAVVEAVVCGRPMTHEAMRKDLASHFQRLLAYDHCTIFFHLSYAYIKEPATITAYLKEMAAKEAPDAFKYQRSEEITHTDSRPPGFVAEYEGQHGPVKVVFLILDMAQEAQQDAANRSAVTKAR